MKGQTLFLVRGWSNGRKNCKLGYINVSGQWVIEPEYERADEFHEGLAVAYNEETRGKYKYGYMNRLGEFAVPLQYERTEIFSEGRGAIQSSESKKWGAVDKSGKLVIPFKFLNSFHFYDRVALAYENFEGTGVIDINGEYIIGPKFESIDKFREGLANVRDKKTRKHGFIDLSGEYVIAPTLQYANGFSGGFAAIGEISGK